MIIEINESFSFENKATADATNPKVQEWEKLMWKFQQPLPWAKAGEKWILMDKIFELTMTIDTHVHFWKYDKKRDAWITDKMKILQQDYLPAHYCQH